MKLCVPSSKETYDFVNVHKDNLFNFTNTFILWHDVVNASLKIKVSNGIKSHDRGVLSTDLLKIFFRKEVIKLVSINQFAARILNRNGLNSFDSIVENTISQISALTHQSMTPGGTESMRRKRVWAILKSLSVKTVSIKDIFGNSKLPKKLGACEHKEYLEVFNAVTNDFLNLRITPNKDDLIGCEIEEDIDLDTDEHLNLFDDLSAFDLDTDDLDWLN